MKSYKEVVLTGIGLLSPIGNDPESYWNALCEGKSGIKELESLRSPSVTRTPIGGEVGDFKAKDFIKPRKNIKVMTRDIQLGFVAAALASQDAGLVTEGPTRTVEPDRFGVVFGADLIGAEIDSLLDAYKAGIQGDTYDFSTWGTAMERIFPLWMLKHLPNMPACHISIGQDARGPSNTVMVCRGSCIASIAEGVRAIQRGLVDVMICGSVGNRINPDFLARAKTYGMPPADREPSTLPRPFDAERCGTPLAEGAGAYILESRAFAEARGANIRARIRGFASTTEAVLHNQPLTGDAIQRAIWNALKMAGMEAGDIGHVNADGLGTVEDDRVEAAAIEATLGDVPVTAPKGSLGDSGAGAGAVEWAASVLALEKGLVPPTCNHGKAATDCRINVVHGKPVASPKPTALKLNQTRMGRSYALIIDRF